MGATSSSQSSEKHVIIDSRSALTPPSLEFSKSQLDFNTKEAPCPLNTPVQDNVDLINNGKRKIKFKFEAVIPTTCRISFSPSSGTVDPGKSKKITAKLTLLGKVNLNFKITLRVQGNSQSQCFALFISKGGESLFLNLRVAGETGVFGIDPSSLDQTDDNGFRVPTILMNMKTNLVNKGGINSEGIFRLAGEQTEIRRLKDNLNNKTSEIPTNDVNAIASLIKIWFRDLPVPILNTLPQDYIMNFSTANDCVSAYESLPEPQKTLLSWLLDFLVQVARNSDNNKMSSQNLAIVIAPNLYDISTPNPMEGLILSQKCAQFLNHVLNSRISFGSS